MTFEKSKASSGSNGLKRPGGWKITTMDEPRYIDVDGEGKPIKQDFPKWVTPKGEIQRQLLATVGRKRYETRDIRRGRAQQEACNEIARACLPLSSGVEAIYPREWVDFCCEWVRGKRSKGKMVTIVGLVNFIRNDDRKRDWLDRHAQGIIDSTDTWERYLNDTNHRG